VVTAIRGDAILTERRKSALIDIDAAFRREAEAASGVLAHATELQMDRVPAAAKSEHA
jgi:hypothetical protein